MSVSHRFPGYHQTLVCKDKYWPMVKCLFPGPVSPYYADLLWANWATNWHGNVDTDPGAGLSLVTQSQYWPLIGCHWPLLMRMLLLWPHCDNHQPIRELENGQLTNRKWLQFTPGTTGWSLHHNITSWANPLSLNLDKYCYNWLGHSSWESSGRWNILKYPQPQRIWVQWVSIGISISLQTR